MAQYEIGIAKSLYYYNPQDETSHNGVLTKCIPAAKVLFRSKIDPILLDLYDNIENPITIDSIDTEANTITISEDKYTATTYPIEVLSKTLVIDNVSTSDDNIILTPKRAIPAGATEFNAQILDTLNIIWGYCLIYQFTITGKELVIRDIVYSKDKYDEGSLIPGNSSDLTDIRTQTLESISSFISAINKSATISNAPFLLRR